jgi:hypothetical protein
MGQQFACYLSLPVASTGSARQGGKGSNIAGWLALNIYALYEG